jgi:hypothetical protein
LVPELLMHSHDDGIIRLDVGESLLEAALGLGEPVDSDNVNAVAAALLQ